MDLNTLDLAYGCPAFYKEQTGEYGTTEEVINYFVKLLHGEQALPEDREVFLEFMQTFERSDYETTVH